MQINRNFLALQESYLFSTVTAKVNAYRNEHPEQKIIRLGIGDVTLPLCGAVVDTLKTASEEMGNRETFHGYGPESGYPFLREAIRAHYAKRKVDLSLEEIFISDGAKSDLGNILDLFGTENTVLIPDPVYPVYVDTNLMAGRTIVFMDASAENDFLPMPDPAVKADLIYLCSPNNPTGAVYSREQLKVWVDYANAQEAVILFDAAYECFIRDDALPHSIFEIEGAETCAIEFCSFSKIAGFTGTRCGYTVIPEALVRENVSLGKLWRRRQSTKFNGVSYIVQRGAAAVFSEEGQKQIRENLRYYQENARIIGEALRELGIFYTGGEHSPYIWLRCPDGMDSWSFFDLLLREANVVGTPGAGFGRNGEGYLRMTAFGDRDETLEAVERMKKLLK